MKTLQSLALALLAGGALAAQTAAQNPVELQFDRIYSAETAPFNTRPNAFLVSVAGGLKPGKALDVAMGQGRNSLYLASQGWQVTGFDISAKGLQEAQAAAAKAGLKITTVKSGYEEFDFGSGQWDLIVFSYAWVPLADPALIGRVRASLRPGGLVVIEHPAEDPAKPVAEREWPPEPTDGVNTLPKAWADGFRILRYEDTEDMCDWRNRKARILRLLARKW
jgi:2-polyprenyl-3-methyl-5-hydroxy-6-metoxy-1,4-benzoquinol methylase